MSQPERNSRRTLIGIVTNRSGDKSIKVTIPYKVPHPLYHKIVNRKSVVHAHDQENAAKVGDRVEIMETRPVSRLKRWRVVAVLEHKVTTEELMAKQDDDAPIEESPAVAATTDES